MLPPGAPPSWLLTGSMLVNAYEMLDCALIEATRVLRVKFASTTEMVSFGCENKTEEYYIPPLLVTPLLSWISWMNMRSGV